MNWTILLAAVLLASCNREEQPQAPTAAEADQLNDAEEMLNGMAKEEGAASEDTAPSVNSN